MSGCNLIVARHCKGAPCKAGATMDVPRAALALKDMDPFIGDKWLDSVISRREGLRVRRPRPGAGSVDPRDEHPQRQHRSGEASSEARGYGVATRGLEPDLARVSAADPARVGPDGAQGLSARLGRAATVVLGTGAAKNGLVRRDYGTRSCAVCNGAGSSGCRSWTHPRSSGVCSYCRRHG
jgi:hypothetical protein